MKTIYFDMDGTIADLYNQKNWLPKLMNEDESPYRKASPLVDMNKLSKICASLQQKGYKIGIITWLSKGATSHYKKKVRQAKREWLKEHFQIELDKIHIVQYGYSKRQAAGAHGDILIDDEERNIKQWEYKGTRKGIYCKNNNEIIFKELMALLN